MMFSEVSFLFMLFQTTMANAQKLKESCGDFVTFGSEQFSSEEQAAVQKALQQRLGPAFIRFVTACPANNPYRYVVQQETCRGWAERDVPGGVESYFSGQ